MMATPPLRPSTRAPNLWLAEDVDLPDDVYVGANVVLHGGVAVGHGSHLEDGVVLGKLTRTGLRSSSPAVSPAPTRLGERTVVGAYAVLCAGATTGADVYVGDHSLVREGAVLADGASIGHANTIGRDARLGARVRLQADCVLGALVVIEEDAFLGPYVSVLAGLTMRDDETGYVPRPPLLRRGCRIGSSAQILPGVVVGEDAVVGAGAVVVHDVPARGRVRGVPAR